MPRGRQACSISRPDRSPWTRPSFWVIQVLIILDLSLTVTGILGGGGIELNPFFAPLTELGAIPMAVGAIFYITAISFIYWISSNWFRATLVGFLLAIHTFGVLSWMQLLFISELTTLFSNYFLPLIGGAMIGSVAAIMTYVNITSCPTPLENPNLQRKTATIHWVNRKD